LMEVIQMQAEQATGRRRYQRHGGSKLKWVMGCSWQSEHTGRMQNVHRLEVPGDHCCSYDMFMVATH
jgi:hypothetical protein